MPALIDLRRRIRSVRNTQQITLAMKNVATAKFKKAQRVVLESRPYWHSYPDLTETVAYWARRSCHPLLSTREEKKIRVLVITSDKGLCGAFNSNLLEAAEEFLKEKSKTCEPRLVLIGKKANIFFKRHDFQIDRTYAEKVHTLTHLDLRDLSRFFIQSFMENRADAVYVVYNEFKSILAPRVTITKLLPIEPVSGEKNGGEETQNTSFRASRPDWDPEKTAILDDILPHYVEIQLQHFFLESQAAEQAARMMAMDNATNNAEELIDDLTLVMNKIRQASITTELLEIMSAVEALAKR